MPIATIQLPNGKIAKVEVPEGATPQDIESFVMSQPEFQAQPEEPEQSFLGKVGEAALEMGPGLGELAVGGAQKVALLAGKQDIAQRLGEQVKKEREDLTTAQKVGRGVGKIIGTAPLGAGMSILKGAAVGGAGLSALDPITEEEATPKAAVRQIATGTAASVAGAGVLKGATKALGFSANKIGNKLFEGKASTPITSSTLKARSSELFKAADDKGGVLNQDFVDDFIATSNKELTPKSGIGKVLEADSLPAKVLEKLDSIKKEKFDLAGIQDLDSYLGFKIDSTANLTGAISDEGRKLLNLQSKLRDSLDKISPKDVVGGKQGFAALKKAKKLWSKSLRLGDIERIIAKGDLSDNPATAIKTGFRSLANNPKRLRGFSKEEIRLIKRAAKSGLVADSLRTMGSRLIPIGTALSGGGVAGTGLGLGASAASRGLAAKGQVSRGREVASEIARSALRSPAQEAALLRSQRNKQLIDQLILRGGLGAATTINNNF